MENGKLNVDGLIPTWKDVIEREYEEWKQELDGKQFEIWTDDMESAFETCLKIILEELTNNNE